MAQYHFTSVTRIAHLTDDDVELEPLARPSWHRGQYVAAAVIGDNVLPYEIERVDGRRALVVPGDVIIGALGTRAATLECVGDWADVGDDLRIESLTMAGVIGRCTSRSPFARPVIPLEYRGHLRGPEGVLTMEQFAISPEPTLYSVPTILIIGTSMSAGKTFAAQKIIRSLTQMGLTVAAAKFTGVGRYRDALSMADAGAEHVFDFCDAGLPSTVVPTEDYRRALDPLMSAIAAARPDVAVIEAGASPLEPYNGEACVETLRPHTRCVVLCASDPYAAQGVMSAFEITPDLISGRATSTQAAVDLVERLSGVQALNLLDPASKPALAELLRARLGPGVVPTG